MIEDEVISALKRGGVDYALSLPCARTKRLVDLAGTFDTVNLSREEEGVGIGAGLWMGGKKPVMLIQSSGIGNCINALMSLTLCYRLPLPILISWRGVYGEKIEAQKYLGERIQKILKAIDVEAMIFDGSDLDDLENAVAESYEEGKIKAILLRPDIWTSAPDLTVERPSISAKSAELKEGRAKYTRYEILDGVKKGLEGGIVISNLGYPSRELFDILDQPTNFYMLGSMGLATPIGLGIALSGKETIVIDGDGSLLMNPSTLFTSPPSEKLTILAIDNGVHGSTGNQPTASMRCDLGLLAIAAGFRVFRTSALDEIVDLLGTEKKGKKFIHVPAKPGNRDVPTIPLSAIEIKERFMKAIR